MKVIFAIHRCISLFLFYIFKFQIRGEDLIAKVIDLRATHGTFADLPTGRWVGCKGEKKIREIYCKKNREITHIFCNIGSGPTYGGYPCSLWTLWHVLTVNQDKDETPPSKVITKRLCRNLYKIGFLSLKT